MRSIIFIIHFPSIFHTRRLTSPAHEDGYISKHDPVIMVHLNPNLHTPDIKRQQCLQVLSNGDAILKRSHQLGRVTSHNSLSNLRHIWTDKHVTRIQNVLRMISVSRLDNYARQIMNDIEDHMQAVTSNSFRSPKIASARAVCHFWGIILVLWHSWDDSSWRVVGVGQRTVSRIEEPNKTLHDE